MAKKKKKMVAASGEAPRGEVPTFEQALARLEAIVQRLEGGQLSLSESLAQYEQGVRCLRYCYRQLDRAERKIELLSGVDPQGRVTSRPFDESAMSLEEKQAARSRRRSSHPDPADPDAGEAEIDGGGALF